MKLVPLTFPDGADLPVDTKQLGKLAATMFFAQFKLQLGDFEGSLVEIFGIEEKKDILNFVTSLHFELLCMITMGIFNGICGPETKEGPERIKILFNETFQKISKLLELYYPSMKFMAYSISMEKDGKPKDNPESH